MNYFIILMLLVIISDTALLIGTYFLNKSVLIISLLMYMVLVACTVYDMSMNDRKV